MECNFFWVPSNWSSTCNNINHFIEIGPGKVLSGLVKRIDKSVKIDTINNENDIKNLVI